MSAGTVLCECGCGHPAPIAERSRPSMGHVKGRPLRFIQGHSVDPGHRDDGTRVNVSAVSS